MKLTNLSLYWLKENKRGDSTKIRNGRGDITTNFTEMKRIVSVL